MSNRPRGCLAFLFGFGGSPSSQGKVFGSSDLRAGEEGNYHSGPGGYEGMGYLGGYAAEYLAEHTYFDDSDLGPGEEQ